MIYGYIRVSTDKQRVENQRFEINNFCEHQNIVIGGWIEETISGIKKVDKRKLGKLLKKAKSGDTIICSGVTFPIEMYSAFHFLTRFSISERYDVGTSQTFFR